MRKEEADVLKQGYRDTEPTASALEFMSPELLEETEQVLNFFGKGIWGS